MEDLMVGRPILNIGTMQPIPQQAYNIYKSGYGGSAVGSIFNKYRLKFSFMEDNQEQASFEI